MATTTTELSATEKSVLEQLLENTGRHMLDSGGAYGRSWEQNQAAGAEALLAEQPTALSFSWGISVTHRLAHWLPERVDYQPELDSLFERWAQAESGQVEIYRFDSLTTVKRADVPWLQSATEWAALLGARGIYGDGDPVVINTYNGEDLLSQTLQYVLMTLESDVRLRVTEVEGGVDVAVVQDEEQDGSKDDCFWPAGEYVLLQVHGGCDVRGGYTRPRVYAHDTDDSSLLDNARATIYCTADDTERECVGEYDQRTNWSTDDGYHWYADGSTAGTGLEDYDRVEVSTDELPPVAERIGKLVVDTDKDEAYCPNCGVCTLAASAY